MEPKPAGPSAQSTESGEDFSLVLGGPLYQMFRRAHLSGSALELLRRRIVIITGVAWLPLLVLSVLEGHAWGNSVSLPFLYDVDAHARFLVSMSLLIVGEMVVHRRMSNLVSQFIERGLIPDDARTDFENAIASAKRMRNSVPAELLLLAFVYSVGVFVIWRAHGAVDVLSWRGASSSGSLNLFLAGWWFGLVSLPTFQFLLFRWYYRLFIWARFLWQVSRIRMNLVATHPDRTGGLGFLSYLTVAFTPLLLAQGTLLAGTIADRIFYAGGKLTQFQVEIIGLVAVAVLATLGPLLVFSPQLAQVKRASLRDYGLLAQQYVRDFDRKWLRGGATGEESLLGSGDIQSLADLGNSYEVIKEMSWVPFNLRTIVQLGITTLAPISPLVLTIIPFDELIARLVKVFF
ncbi:MAG TPA: hypothetical protein VFV34_24720 [Blastocatellia bacterium]|nr:hypothetical protein [Blastocatellia bacterium]